MPQGLYPVDPLSPEERDEYERDLIAFCDRELDRLGDIRGNSVLYAGGTSPLWIEGLAQRLGPSGSLTVLDTDEDGLRLAEESFGPGELPLAPEYVVGDVFDLPFGPGSFDLVYSSGLLHELDVRERESGILDALREMEGVLIPGGSVAFSDFVSDVPSSQVEEEAIEAGIRQLSERTELFGVRNFEFINGLLREEFTVVGTELHAPFGIRHLDRLFFAQTELEGLDTLRPEDAARLRRRWNDLREQVEREGYTRPATVFATLLAT